MEREIDKMHERVACKVALNWGKDKSCTPDNHYDKDEYPTRKIIAVDQWWSA